MYDTIRISKNLHKDLKDFDKQRYQTKELDSFLKEYVVDESGQLIDCSEDEVIPSCYTGQIRFYDEEGDFVAWCVKGVVKEIIKLND